MGEKTSPIHGDMDGGQVCDLLAATGLGKQNPTAFFPVAILR